MNMQRGMPPADKVREWVLEAFRAQHGVSATAYIIRAWVYKHHGKLIPSKLVKEFIDELVVEKWLERSYLSIPSPLQYYRIVV